MSGEEIKLTVENNTTTNGIPFPDTPKPQIITETFSFDDNSKFKNNISVNGND